MGFVLPIPLLADRRKEFFIVVSHGRVIAARSSARTLSKLDHESSFLQCSVSARGIFDRKVAQGNVSTWIYHDDLWNFIFCGGRNDFVETRFKKVRGDGRMMTVLARYGRIYGAFF